MEEAAFPRLCCERWPIETKCNQLKQKFELGNLSVRLVDAVKQDFHAMMTASNTLSSGLREANEKIAKGKTKRRKYECRANVNHAVGVLKERLIGILTTEDNLARKYLYRELVSETRWRIAPTRPSRETPRKKCPKNHIFTITTSQTVERGLPLTC
jgi:hypothetical protein